jgi:hypothetical protein
MRHQFIQYIVFIFAIVTVSPSYADTQKQPKHGSVLMIQMIPEFWTDQVASHLESGFHQAGWHPDFYIVDANSDARNGIKYDGKLTADTLPDQLRFLNQSEEMRLKRLQEGVKEIASQLRSEGRKITHISLAGHGAVKGGLFLMGELRFDARVHEVKQLFAPLKPYLAEHVKILLTSCSIFAGNKSDVKKRAELLQEAIGSRTMEVFGYSQITSTKTIYDFYGTNKLGIGIGATVAALLPSLLVFPGQKSALAATAFVSFLFNGYNYFAYDWQPFKQMRQNRNPSEMGYVVTLENGSSKELKKGLGNDYFNKYFVTPNPLYPFPA